MNSLHTTILVAMAAVCASTGCSDNVPEHVDQNSQPLLKVLYGADSMRRAIKAEAARLGGSIDYYGEGTAVGQAALVAGSQCIAPMSRDFTSCHSGAASQMVALDGILLYVADGELTPEPNYSTKVTYKVLKRLYAGPNGDGTSCTQYKWSSPSTDIGDLTTTDPDFANQNIKLYRLDDNSGTTDVLKTKLGITGFCPSTSIDITTVRDAISGCTGVSGTCVTCNSKSATDCLPQLVGQNKLALGYASMTALLEPGFGSTLKALDVSIEATNTTGGTYRAPTEANIRKIQSVPSTAYPLSRPVFVNHDLNNACSSSEVDFINNSLGVQKCAFETSLVNAGFVACRAGGPRTDPDSNCFFCAGFAPACP